MSKQPIKEILLSMREIATTLDEQGKLHRSNGITYKAGECFLAANELRKAANDVEMALSWAT